MKDDKKIFDYSDIRIGRAEEDRLKKDASMTLEDHMRNAQADPVDKARDIIVSRIRNGALQEGDRLCVVEFLRMSDDGTIEAGARIEPGTSCEVGSDDERILRTSILVVTDGGLEFF